MIQLDVHDGVARLTLAHGRANALDVELLRELPHALEEAGGRAPAVVLTGQGTVFSAGIDLKRLLAEEPAHVDELLPALVEACAALFFLPRPVVAAVNGHAIAGGGVLTCAADLRLMARGGGRIGVPELLVGVPFPLVALEIVRSRVAPSRLPELVFRGLTLEAEPAREAGLIDEVVDAESLLETAHERARALAGLPADVFAHTKEQLRAPSRARLAAETAADREFVAAAWKRAETREGIRTYLERLRG